MPRLCRDDGPGGCQACTCRDCATPVPCGSRRDGEIDAAVERIVLLHARLVEIEDDVGLRHVAVREVRLFDALHGFALDVDEPHAAVADLANKEELRHDPCLSFCREHAFALSGGHGRRASR
ncbi:MAG: hypothetical protein WDM84_02405 [Bauldia sp.]